MEYEKPKIQDMEKATRACKNGGCVAGGLKK